MRSRGRHTAGASLLTRLGRFTRTQIETFRREPLVLDGDIDTGSNDPEAWLAPLQQGGIQVERKLRAEYQHCGGWLGRPRKPRSSRKRRQKELVAKTTGESGAAA